MGYFLRETDIILAWEGLHSFCNKEQAKNISVFPVIVWNFYTASRNFFFFFNRVEYGYF